MSVIITIDTSEVHALAAELRAGADEAFSKAERVVAKTAFDIAGTAQTLAPVDTGDLKNSIGADVDSLHAVIGPTVEYGGWVEEGTEGPYPIPNAFGWGITVMHPGNDPQPYLGPAADVHADMFEHAIGAIGESIL